MEGLKIQNPKDVNVNKAAGKDQNMDEVWKMLTDRAVSHLPPEKKKYWTSRIESCKTQSGKLKIINDITPKDAEGNPITPPSSSGEGGSNQATKNADGTFSIMVNGEMKIIDPKNIRIVDQNGNPVREGNKQPPPEFGPQQLPAPQ